MKKKVVYITGGSKGIGKGIAKYLLDNGYRVAISGRAIETTEKSANDLTNNSEEILAIKSDVRNPEDERKAIKEIENKWGRLDVLIANAGIGKFGSIEMLTHDDWSQTIDTNINGVFNSVKAALDAIIKSKGYIFTIASLAGANFFENGTAYNASKFAIVGFTQALMLDLRHKDVKVTTVMPGSVSSHFNNNVPSEKDNWKIQPEDIGEIIYNVLKMHPRTLPSKIEVRPTKPPN